MLAHGRVGLRAVAQSKARELGPQNIHLAHLVIDAGVARSSGASGSAMLAERKRFGRSSRIS